MAGGNRRTRVARWRELVCPRSCLTLYAAACAALLLTTGSTYATLSDTETSAMSAIAATVVFGDEPTDPFKLAYSELAPGDSHTRDLTIKYDGNVPADITLGFRSGTGSTICTPTGDALPGGDLLVTIGKRTESYCSLLDGEEIALGSAEPGTTLIKAITVRLTDDASDNYSKLSNKGGMILRASSGFSDRVVGSIDISTADFGPDVPATPEQCADMSFNDDQVIVLGPNQHEWDAGREAGNGAGPFLVFGTNDADVITGSNKADCIVGGGGADVLNGGNGEDVLLGGDGADTLNGGNSGDELFGGGADDTLVGGNGSDELYGEGGHDDLTGGNGPDKLDGGDDGAICDGGKGHDRLSNCDPEEGSAKAKEREPGSAADARERSDADVDDGPQRQVKRSTEREKHPPSFSTEQDEVHVEEEPPRAPRSAADPQSDRAKGKAGTVEAQE